jgi:hypothetical protein
MKKRYRIVTDNYLGYEVQETFLNFFWFQSKNRRNNNINTHRSIEKAKQHIEDLKNKKFDFKSIIVYTE